MQINNVDLKGFKEVPFPEIPFSDFHGDVDTRWQQMNGVLLQIIDSYKQPIILDAASGGGHDSIYLLQRGYDVTSNEIDDFFASDFKARAAKAAVKLQLLGIDWRDFLTSEQLKPNEFDVVFT